MEGLRPLIFLCFVVLETLVMIITGHSLTILILRFVYWLIARPVQFSCEIFGKISMILNPRHEELTSQILEPVFELRDPDNQAQFIIQSYRTYNRIDAVVDLINDPDFKKFVKYFLKRASRDPRFRNNIILLRNALIGRNNQS